MRQTFFIFILVTIAILFFSCDKCRYADCPDTSAGQFRIVSASSGQDLVFGPSKIYDKTKIKFFSITGTDTTFFRYRPDKYRDENDSILYVSFNPNADFAYMRLSDGDVDTLNIYYKTLDTKCCGARREITNFRYNNAIDIPGKGTQVLRK